MSDRESLKALVDHLSKERLRQLLDYARFLESEQELMAWQRFGEQEFARAYGPDEPEYTEADIEVESDS